MKTLLSQEQLSEGIRRLSEQIQQRYQGKPLTLIGVFSGSVMLLADLIRLLDMPLRINVLEERRNLRGDRPGPPAINIDQLRCDVEGRHVLLVDDIFATGQTLWELVPQLDELNPASVHSVVLLRKVGLQTSPISPDFVGFDIPADVYVVGYGLDYQDRYRNLPYLATLEPQDQEAR